MAKVFVVGFMTLGYFFSILMLEFSIHRQRIRDSFLSADFKTQLQKLVAPLVIFVIAILLGVVGVVLQASGVTLSVTLRDFLTIVSFISLLGAVVVTAVLGVISLFEFQAGIVRKKAYPFIWFGIIAIIAVIRGVGQQQEDFYFLFFGLQGVLTYRIFEEYFFARFIHLNDLFNRLQDSIRVRNELVDKIIHSAIEEDHLVVEGMFEESILSSQKEATLPQYRITGAVVYRRVGDEFLVEHPGYIYGFSVPLYENEIIRKVTREQLVIKLQSEHYSLDQITSTSTHGQKQFGLPRLKEMLEKQDVVKIRDLPSCFKGLVNFIALYPIVDQEVITGFIVVYKDSFHDVFPQEDKILKTLAGNLSTVFNIMIGKQLQEERNRLQGEMNIATNIQTSILPKKITLPGYQIAASMETATEVGGDVYDWVNTKYGNYLSIGDVSGHGLPAGIMALIQMSAFHGAIETSKVLDKDLPVPDLYNIVNRVLCTINRDRIGADKFMTANYFLEKEGMFQHAGAHEIALLYRAKDGKVDEIHQTVSRTGFLGLSEYIDASSSTGDFKLAKGDVLLLYTDGIIEAMNAANEQFGLKGIGEVLTEFADQEPEKIISELQTAVKSFAEKGDLLRHKGSFADDITMVVIKRIES
jgi:sigma-B regulation protein RsbU (phosphoserine phosphatase)